MSESERSRPRAEIIETGDPRLKAASIIINAPAKLIFDLLANPRSHKDFDGSATVQGLIKGPERLFLGARFGMKMKIGIPYRITNVVTEFEENKLISWRHLGRWIWRYEIREISANQSVVTETFDARKTPFNFWLKSRKAYPFVQVSLAKTLVRLKLTFEAPL
jgi:hypothetical protein